MNGGGSIEHAISWEDGPPWPHNTTLRRFLMMDTPGTGAGWMISVAEGSSHPNPKPPAVDPRASPAAAHELSSPSPTATLHQMQPCRNSREV